MTYGCWTVGVIEFTDYYDDTGHVTGFRPMMYTFVIKTTLNADAMFNYCNVYTVSRLK